MPSKQRALSPEQNQLIDSLQVFAFQPEESFYSYPFDERLRLLEERILLAKRYLAKKEGGNTSKQSPSFWAKSKLEAFKNTLSGSGVKQAEQPPRAIFVAPEYLFKNLSEFCYKRYCTQEQKNQFKKRLQALSVDTDMLIVPGTMCWYKKGADQENYYRNTAYFFYRGDLQKYKKRNPHTNYDFDYTNEGFLNLMDLRRVYFKSGQLDTPVKNYFGLKIGIEICFDSVQGELVDFIKTNNLSIDVQLIIADGAKKPVLVKQEGVLFVKLERNPLQTELGTIIKIDNKHVELKPAIALGKLEEENDLTCFQFK
ncbi:TPA: hypothetical protein ACPSKE_002557 [Legionella feeleii]